jgi:hypothetical protein
MTKPKNHNKAWTPPQVVQLKTLAKGNTPTRVIALKLGRTPEAVQSEASKEGISLKPTNQSPYGTHK